MRLSGLDDEAAVLDSELRDMRKSKKKKKAELNLSNPFQGKVSEGGPIEDEGGNRFDRRQGRAAKKEKRKRRKRR